VTVTRHSLAVQLRFDFEFGHGIGWSLKGDKLRRTSHAIVAADRVWLTDVVDGPGLDERISVLGEPAAVVQLLDRHERDCATIAERLGVPLHVTPFADVAGAPFIAFPIVRQRFWREVALWFAEQRTLVFGDALGSLSYFRAPGEPFGVHPLLRLFPPRLALAGLEPDHILFGHGPGYHDPEAPEALHTALATARRRLPQAWLSGLRTAVRRG
jgi:hypothetical protein